MQFAILGPFTVLDDGEAVTIGRGTERALLALLALNTNQPLPADRIIDALWGDSAPPSARDMVRLYVSRARGRIGDHLINEDGGYILRVGDDAVDLDLFERRRRIGANALAAGDPETAALELEQALELWRGTALGEFADLPFAREEIPRLEELRLGVAEDYYQARLDLGAAAELIPSLERLVDDHPFRERARAQLMLALYRAGRQTDALARYRDGRRVLAEEIGIEPGPELRELERAILVHDPGLAAAPLHGLAAAPPAQPSSDPASPSTSRRRLARLAVVAIGLAVAAAGIAVGLLATQGSATGLRSLPPNSVGLVDTSSGKLEAAVRLPGVPVGLAASANRLWVALGEPHEIVEVDPGQRKVLETIPLRAVPRRIAPAPDGVWVAESYYGTIAHVNAITHAVGKSIRLFRPTRISFAAGQEFWAASNGGDNAARLDPKTAHVLERFAPLDAPIAATNGFDAVWFASATHAEVERLSHRRVTRVPIGSPPVDITAGSSTIWAVSPADDKLWGINPKNQAVVHVVDVGPDPESVVAGGGSIWVGSRQAASVTRVDPRTSQVVSTLELQRPVTALNFYAGQLWVAGA